jgi:hypothetical protein
MARSGFALKVEKSDDFRSKTYFMSKAIKSIKKKYRTNRGPLSPLARKMCGARGDEIWSLDLFIPFFLRLP